MATTHIRVTLNEALQIKAGRVPVDAVDVPLADVLPLLGVLPREELARCPARLQEGPFNPELAEATPEIVAEQLKLRGEARVARKLVQEEADRERKQREEERLAEVAAQRAKLDAEYLTRVNAGKHVDCFDRDGDVATHWRSFFERHPEALATARASREAAVAEREARDEADNAQARAFVIAHVPEYRRAAEDGCDVRHRATEAVLAWLKERDAVETHGDDVHTCPSAQAYAKLDEVKQLIHDVPGDVLRNAEVMITRGDLANKLHEKRIRTCVRVDCELPWGEEIDRSFLAEGDPDLIDED